jgi:hypothetical protein
MRDLDEGRFIKPAQCFSVPGAQYIVLLFCFLPSLLGKHLLAVCEMEELSSMIVT